MERHNHFLATWGIFGIITKFLLGILIAAGMAMLFGFVVLWLWNWLMPEIFGLGKITFWQSWGLIVLAHILFKSFPHPKHPAHDDRWKKHFREKYCNVQGEKEQQQNQEPVSPLEE
jgi:hypothetical protein